MPAGCAPVRFGLESERVAQQNSYEAFPRGVTAGGSKRLEADKKLNLNGTRQVV